MALPSFLPSSYLGIFITLCSPSRQREAEGDRLNANTLFYPSETVLSKKITRKRMVLSFKDSPWKPLERRPRQTKRLPPQKAPKNPISKGRKKEHRTFHCALGVKLHRKKRSISPMEEINSGKGVGWIGMQELRNHCVCSGGIGVCVYAQVISNRDWPRADLMACDSPFSYPWRRVVCFEEI